MNESFFFETAFRIINKYNTLAKKPRAYNNGNFLLYSAETHMLEVIGSCQPVTASAIAERMAITKGAVSQTTAKLLQKGLIQKEAVSSDPRAFLVTLTPDGTSVFEEHRAFHRQMIDEVDAVLASMSEEGREQLKTLLTSLDTVLDSYM